MRRDPAAAASDFHNIGASGEVAPGEALDPELASDLQMMGVIVDDFRADAHAHQQMVGRQIAEFSERRSQQVVDRVAGNLEHRIVTQQRIGGIKLANQFYNACRHVTLPPVLRRFMPRVYAASLRSRQPDHCDAALMLTPGNGPAWRRRCQPRYQVEPKSNCNSARIVK